MANTVSISALRPEIWQKELMKNVMDNLYFTQSGLMGEGENNIVQIKTNLKKTTGDTITIPLTAKLSGVGITGDNELEGNEEAINAYSESVIIDQWRDGVRLTGKLDEQMNAYNMRTDAKNKLSMILQEFIEQQIFLKLGGVGNVNLTDISGNIVGTLCKWSNTPTAVPAADTAAGYGDRYLCADYTDGADSLAATDLLTPALISRAKIKASTKMSDGMPKVNPLRVNGQSYYILFVHPYQAFDLKNNATFAQAQREAGVRGDSNRVFTGALGVWDGVIIKEHEYVPYLLPVTTSNTNFAGATGGTQFTNAVKCFRALLCGQQAAVFAQTKDSMKMYEKSFDYENQVGYATGLIGGIQKLTFNSIDYGVVSLDTSATALV